MPPLGPQGIFRLHPELVKEPGPRLRHRPEAFSAVFTSARSQLETELQQADGLGRRHPGPAEDSLSLLDPIEAPPPSAPILRVAVSR